MRGEAAFQVEELQQQREPEPGRARLVRDQLPVAVDQRPGRDQLLGLPLATHEHETFRKTALRRRPNGATSPHRAENSREVLEDATLPLATGNRALGRLWWWLGRVSKYGGGEDRARVQQHDETLADLRDRVDQR